MRLDVVYFVLDIDQDSKISDLIIDCKPKDILLFCDQIGQNPIALFSTLESAIEFIQTERIKSKLLGNYLKKSLNEVIDD